MGLKSKILLSVFMLVSLSGCLTPSKQSGDFITIKPSAAQIESAARAIVCDSFKRVKFSKANDTPLTVAQVRQNNAALGTFKCAD